MRLKNELNQARTLGIFDELGHEAYFDNNSDDGFPHREMPIFARNEQIWQELDARQRKRKIEAEEDRQAWSQWDQRRFVLVQRYNNYTAENATLDLC